MAKKRLNCKMLRYSLPRRSKSQFYMNIIPILPDFNVIIKNIEKIRALTVIHIETSKNDKPKPKKEEKKKKEPEIPVKIEEENLPDALRSPKFLRKRKVKNYAIIEEEQSVLEPKVSKKITKTHYRRKPRVAPLLPTTVAVKRQILKPKRLEKSKDERSNTLFNSIEEHFL